MIRYLWLRTYICPGATLYRDEHICEECLSKGIGNAVQHGCYRGSRLQTLICVISILIHRVFGIYRKINYICLTDFNKEKIQQINSGSKRIIVPEKIFVKPNFTFENPFSPQEGFGDYYLFLGRIEKLKGIDLLIEAFMEMPEYQLQIAGTGPEMERYQKKISQQGIHNIKFLGFLKKEEVNRKLANARGLIVTSQCYETFGMIIIEAYASRVPVIGGDLGNVAALIDSGKTGLKFAYNSAEDLKKAIRNFEKLDIINMGDQAYLKYQEHYSAEQNYQQLMEIYEKISC